MGCTPDRHSHSHNVRRSEQAPGSLVIQKYPVLHQIIIGKIIPVDHFQRMKIEKIAAHSNDIDRDALSADT